MRQNELIEEFIESGFSAKTGFANFARVTGYVRDLDGSVMWIQQTALHDLALPVICAVSAPPCGTVIGSLITVCGHMKNDGANGAVLVADSWPTVNPAHAPLGANKPVPAGARPERVVSLVDTGLQDEEDASNFVCLAGFVREVRNRRARSSQDVNGATKFTLAMSENPSEDIPVAAYGVLAERYADRIEPGSPVMVMGAYRASAKPISQSEGAGEERQQDGDGYSKVTVRWFVKAIAKIGIPTPEMIVSIPPWAQELRDANKPSRRRASA